MVWAALTFLGDKFIPKVKDYIHETDMVTICLISLSNFSSAEPQTDLESMFGS